ncbi:MAG: hypothetical protein ISS82_01980 [Nanoarchaeota archaeon]|nr:hypothetical protein [Nanoarchaeota archaeon]
MVEEMKRGMIAFDGLSLAGKSTMVQMLYLRSLNAVVIRENEFDPIRNATSRLNKLLKSMSPYDGLDALAEEFQDIPLVVETSNKAKNYIKELNLEGSSYVKDKQAALAYFFTKGRSFVNEEVIKQLQEHDKDVILDRWLVSGMAYQVQPNRFMAKQMGLPDEFIKKINCEDEAYRWQDIRDLNFEQGVWVPNMQIILTCPIEQISERRVYRQKQGVGTSGQMSGGREEIIYHSLMEINEWLLEKGIPSFKVENTGTPIESLQEQIRQAIPIYLLIEKQLRGCIDRKIVGGFHNYRLANDSLTLKQAKEFFLDSSNIDSIYERQCLGRVKKDMRKVL